MVNFILYEDKEMMRNEYEKIIHKLMGNINTIYKILPFSSYNNQLKAFIKNNTGSNIYILDIEVPGKSGLDLAREIRSSGDIYSQLIIVTAHREMLENTFINRSLVLNFVSKFDNCKENLFSALISAYSNITKHKAFAFKSNGELYRIPYEDIYFFESEAETNNVIMHTRDNHYTVNSSIKNILQKLNDPRFMKTHKSCIVNLFNIKKIDLSELIIYFNNNLETNLLSRNYKKELQDKLIQEG